MDGSSSNPPIQFNPLGDGASSRVAHPLPAIPTFAGAPPASAVSKSLVAASLTAPRPEGGDGRRLDRNGGGEASVSARRYVDPDRPPALGIKRRRSLTPDYGDSRDFGGHNSARYDPRPRMDAGPPPDRFSRRASPPQHFYRSPSPPSRFRDRSPPPYRSMDGRMDPRDMEGPMDGRYRGDPRDERRGGYQGRDGGGGYGYANPRDRDWDQVERDRDRDSYRARDRDQGRGDMNSRLASARKERPPDSEEVVVTFREFAAWAREFKQELIEADDAAVAVPGQRKPLSAAYNDYRQRFTSRQLWALFLAHRDEPWFKEKYSSNPIYQELRTKIALKGRVPAATKFLQDLQKGEYRNVNFDRDPSKDLVVSRGQEYEDDKQLCRVAPGKNQIFIKAIHPSISYDALHETMATGGSIEYIALGEPIQKKNFLRAGWVQYAEGTDIPEAVRKLDDTEIGGFVLHVNENKLEHINKVRTTPGISNALPRLKQDIKQAREMALAIEAPLLLTEEEIPLGSDPSLVAAEKGKLAGSAAQFLDAAVAKVQQKRELDKPESELSEEQAREKARIELDHWLIYLREGLHTCYYCVASNDHAEELYRKCIRHLRQPADESSRSAAAQTSGEKGFDDEHDEEHDYTYDLVGEHGESKIPTINDQDDKGYSKAVASERRWATHLDHKLALISQPATLDPKDYGGKDIEYERRKISEPLVRQEEAEKFRCRQCSKLFKSDTFVFKHITVKHPDILQDVNDDVPYFNAFAMDPQHLVPHREQPASVADQLPARSLLPPQAPELGPRRGEKGKPRNGGRGGGGGGDLAGRIGSFSEVEPYGGIEQARVDARLLAQQASVSDDPRAARGRVNYRDLDAPQTVPDGGGLPY